MLKVSVAIVTSVLLGWTSVTACQTTPTTPGPFSTWSLANRWNSQGVRELRSENYTCALQEFSQAIRLYRSDVRAKRFRATLDLAFALTEQAIALSKLGNRRAAARNWAEAAALTTPASYEVDETALRADRLFARRRYRQAFQLYRLFVSAELTPGERDNGAASAIKRGLDLALRGEYSQAAATFKRSAPSQAAYYLEGQAASIIHDYRWAYDAYVDELLAYLDLPATGSPYGNAFDRPAMLRLVALTQ